MFDLGLDKEKEELVARVATLARERFAPRAAAYDRDAAFPAEDFVDLFKAGLFGASIPREYGGLGLGPYFDDRGMHLTPETPTYSMRGCGGLPADAGGV